jgi:hypothetical protein
MNLAVLVTDYLTYEFESGALNYYPKCDTCDSDSLPFLVDIVPPGDFGSVAFTYTETGDTLFFGTMIWLGRGELVHPDNVLSGDRFGELSESARDPSDWEYFDQWSSLDKAEFEAKADTAWAYVKRLDIVWDFAARDYRVGVYLYTPAVGPVVPAEARWIIFLYRNG